MTKKFIFNTLLNLGLLLLIMMGVAAYQNDNLFYLGLAIALSVMLIYLKIVLLKYVSREVKARQNEQAKALKNQQSTRSQKKSGR